MALRCNCPGCPKCSLWTPWGPGCHGNPCSEDNKQFKGKYLHELDVRCSWCIKPDRASLLRRVPKPDGSGQEPPPPPPATDGGVRGRAATPGSSRGSAAATTATGAPPPGQGAAARTATGAPPPGQELEPAAGPAAVTTAVPHYDLNASQSSEPEPQERARSPSVARVRFEVFQNRIDTR